MKYMWEESDIKAGKVVLHKKFGMCGIFSAPNLGFILIHYDSNSAVNVLYGVFSCESFIINAKSMADYLTDHDFVMMNYDEIGEIKDHKGVMLDGVYIKSTDPLYDHALAVIGARRVDNSRNQMNSWDIII